MTEQYRVGCWNATYKEDSVELRHDSMDEPVETDFQEIHDLDDIVAILHLKSKADNNVEDADSRLNNLVRELEAQR